MNLWSRRGTGGFMKHFPKKLIAALVSILLVFALAGCSTTEKVESVPEIVIPQMTLPVAPAPAPAPAPSADVVISDEEGEPEGYPFGVEMITKSEDGADAFDLYIFHTNDVHARVTEGEDGSIGYSKLSSIIKQARNVTDNVLVIDAGDVTHGTNFANFFNGSTIGDLLALVGYDVVVPGNHDFNYGYQNILDLAAKAEANSDLRVLSANITDEDGNLLLQPYQLYSFNGFKVCVFGLTTPDTKIKAHPKYTEGIEFMSDEVVNNAQKAVDLAHQYADYVIVVGHLGIVDDGISGVTSTYVCENIDGIDLFIDGHSHSELTGDNYVNGTLVVSAGQYMNNIGLVDIRVENGKAVDETALLITAEDVADPASSEIAQHYGISEISDDAQVLAYIDSVNAKLDEALSRVIATVDEDLDGERSNVRTRKTNLSELVCKALTEESGADFTIINGGGIRASIKKGDVTLGMVNDTLPFTNVLNVCEITGAEVYEALEWGYSVLPEENGAFSQTDLTVVYNIENPAGERILNVLLNGQPIDKEETYLVATNDFMAAGGDGYTMFGKVVQEGRVLNEIFADYLSANYPVN